jgi:dihydropteroate synthase
MKWQLRERTIDVDRPLIMGILNVTPDSFSDGGHFLDPDAAVAHALTMLDEGADIIDIGGESTRPQGARPVPADDELRRILPVVHRLAAERPDATLSIDTVKSDVARAALAAGAHLVNDVSGLRLDPRVATVCAELGAGIVLMHSRGGIADMATFAHADYADLVPDVVRELQASIDAARAAGIPLESIAIDPGLGFAKRAEDSIRMVAAVPRLTAWGRPVMIGASRKRFVGAITDATNPADRRDGTLGANVAALALGARIFRVHDVRPHRDALGVAWEILRRG